MALVLPPDFKYVAAAIASTFWLTAYQTVKVGLARKRAGIEYPQLYAEAAQVAASEHARIFNCTQRAHQNTMEWLPQILASTLIIGLKYPIFAASACGVWTVARFIYTSGYSSGNPKKRGQLGAGLINAAVLFGSVVGGTTYTVYKMFYP